MKQPSTYWCALVLLFSLACQSNQPVLLKPQSELLQSFGRVDLADPDHLVLVSAASSVSFAFEGDFCELQVENSPQGNTHSYVNLVLDDENLGRIRISGDSVNHIQVPIENNLKVHQLTMFKATEASTGDVSFKAARVQKLVAPKALPDFKIEFIGNSITSGMGIAWQEIPCDSSEWFDQHYAYYAYGPRVARALDAQFMLSSVSGIGMYRVWNKEEPCMPAVYGNLYLNTDSTPKRDFTQFTPDIVSVCLGTNDFSKGDGSYERDVFSADKFVEKYIDLLNQLYSHYPNTQVILLNSPVFDEEQNELLMSCLERVVVHFDETKSDKPIRTFEFQNIVGHGCTGHPDLEDQAQMAEQLLPFLQAICHEIKP